MVIEIPRNLTANYWKLGLGILLILIAPSPLAAASKHWTAVIVTGVMFGIPGILLVVSNLRLLIVHPPQLRATSEGVAFAGGATIPWHEIMTIYEAGTPIQRYGFSVRTRAIGFTFYRKRTLFRVPSSLWLTTIVFGDVKVSTYAADEPPETLAIKLEGMRTKASRRSAAITR